MAHQPLAYLYREFLESAEARPIRILSEYLEPLRRFKEQKIQDTVVFFGSARVDSRERAERALRTLRSRGERDADEQYQTELAKSQRAVEWAQPVAPEHVIDRLMPDLLDNIEAAALAVDDGPRPNPGSWCDRCSYRNLCPASREIRYEPVEYYEDDED